MKLFVQLKYALTDHLLDSDMLISTRSVQFKSISKRSNLIQSNPQYNNAIQKNDGAKSRYDDDYDDDDPDNDISAELLVPLVEFTSS